MIVYNPQKGRLEKLDVEINKNNTTWFKNDRTPRHVRMITDYQDGIIIAEFDYTYPFYIYDVTRADIGYSAQKQKGSGDSLNNIGRNKWQSLKK